MSKTLAGELLGEPLPERIGPYRIIKMLGSGSFAQVSVGEHVDTGDRVALKVINTSTWSDKNKARRTTLLKREIRLCRLLHHPNVIRMLSTMQEGPNVILIMEHCAGGDLENFTYTQKHKYIGEKKARELFRQVVCGIDYLHKNSITHRDIKPANIILDTRHAVPKLIDFGFTNIFDENEKMQSFLGSPHFAAPELLTGTKYEGPAVDIWSLGVTMYACMTGKLPFQAPNMEKLMDLIVRADFTFPQHLSAEARDLLGRMLTVDTDKRIKMEGIRQHEWLNQGFTSPPPDFSIPRDLPITDIDQPALDALVSFGFEDREANRQAVMREGSSTVKNVYCLLLEARAREQQLQYIEQAKLAPPSGPLPVGKEGVGGGDDGERKKPERHLSFTGAMRSLFSPLANRRGRKRAVSDLPGPRKSCGDPPPPEPMAPPRVIQRASTAPHVLPLANAQAPEDTGQRKDWV